VSTQVESLRRFVAARAPEGARDGAQRAARLPRVVAVGSGKGGVGTSGIAALLGLTVSSRGHDVLLVDGDENVGTLHLLLGARPRYGFGALRRGEAVPEQLLVPLGPTLTLLAGGGAADGDDPLLSSAERRVLFRRASSFYDGYDLVVVDGGSRLDSVLGICGAGVGRLLTVTTGDHISVAAAYALIKATDARFPGIPVEVLVNQQDERTARQAYDQLQAGAAHFLRRAVGYAGAIPDDACLRAGMAAGMTVADAAAGSPTAVAVQEVGLRLLSELDAQAGAAPGPRLLPRRS
jgi:flagellar biosynthesis protein FlhG